MIKQPFDLKTYNTFGFAVKASSGKIIFSVEDLEQAIIHAQTKQMPLLPIGGGSNIVLKDNLPSLALIIRIPGIELLKDEKDHVMLRVGAGVEWDELVQLSLQQNWYGLENLSIIPGTVGACPIQNIGAYGVEIKDLFHELTAFEINSLEHKVLSREDCRFSYRDSIFKNEYKDRFIITSVTFKLNKIPQINITDKNLRYELKHLAEHEISPLHVRQAVIKIRNRRLPDLRYIGNAGSFFMNPIIDAKLFNSVYSQYPDLLFTKISENHYKIAAGWLIERCGWKGFKDNSVGVFEMNALILVHHGGGTAYDLLGLSKKIIQSVYDRFGISLKMEPRLYSAESFIKNSSTSI